MKHAALISFSIFLATILFAERPYKVYETPVYEYQITEPRLKEFFPQDVAEYINQNSNCNHWGGEEPYDEERAKQIEAGVERDCTGLQEKYNSLLSKYSGTPEVLSRMKAIQDDPDKYIWDDPHHKSKVLNEYFEAEAQSIVRTVKEVLPEHEKIVAALNRQETSELKNKLGPITHRLKVQQEYLSNVMKNFDRLHSITQKQIKESEKKLNAALNWNKK